MSIAVEKKKQTSNRYMLVRITPAKYINDDLVLDSGTSYKASFDFASVPRVTRNGVDLTKVDTPSSNDEYSYNELTGEFEVWLASAPNESTNVIVCYFDLFYTGEKARIASDGSVDRQWLPRLERYPVVSESFTNITSGVLTIKTSSLSIINSDNVFNKYTDSTYSFKNKKVSVWLSINDVQPEEIFEGLLDGLELKADSVTLKIVDKFDKLKDTATFGDDESEYLFNESYAFSGPVDPNRIGQPIPMIVGKGSGMRFINASEVTTSNLAIMNPQVKAADVTSMNEAFNAEYATDSTTRNRDFVLCRLLPGANLEIQSIGNMVRQLVVNYGAITKSVHFYMFESHNLKVGETFQWDDGGGPYRAIVQHVGDFSSGSLDFNVMVANIGTNNLTDPIMTDLSDFIASESIVVMKDDGIKPASFDKSFSDLFLRQDGDYTLSTSTTSGGGKVVRVNLLSDIINPEEADKIHYKVELTDVFKHGQCMKAMIDASNLPTNDASFTQADIDYVNRARMQVPEFGESEIRRYIDYVEQLASSTLSFVSTNNLGEVEYNVLQTPASGSVRNEILDIQGSTSVKYDYSDTYSEIQSSNVNNVYDINAGQELTTSSSNLTKHLHEIDKVLVVKSYVEDEDLTRLSAIKNQRNSVYSYETATEDIDSNLGDDIELSSDRVLDVPRQIKITSIQKGVSSTKVKATDLGDL